MPHTDHEKLLQHLNEAHALEAGLVQTLTAHVAVTPAGPYRDLLDRHLAETRAQTARLQERLGELGVTKSPLQAVVGLAETVVGQLVPAAKLPFDLLRGASGEEKLFKNAKDEAASEALEIATYDGLEAVASALGDEKTATLAREHRTQEEVFLRDLRGLIPSLAGAMISAQVDGTPSYDAGSNGLAEAGRFFAGRFARAAGAARSAAEDAVGRAGDAAQRVEDIVEDAVEDVADAAGEVESRVEDAVASGPTADEVDPSGGPSLDEPPIANYDSLTIEQVLPKLEDLDAEELAAVDGIERATKERKRVLDRIAALRRKRVEEELARIG